MARRNNRPKPNNPSAILIGGGLAGLVAVLLIAFALIGSGGGPANTGTTARSALINPTDYTSEFQGEPDHILIDVRTPQEFATGHIPGAVNIPVDEVADRLDEIPAEMDVVVYCRSGNRSAQAARTLINNGYTDVYDLGGIIEWEAAGLPTE